MSSIQKKIEHTIYNCLYKTKINSDMFLSMLLYIKNNKINILQNPQKKFASKMNLTFSSFISYHFLLKINMSDIIFNLLYKSYQYLVEVVVGMIGLGVSVRFMVFNATFNNISVISWRSVLLAEEVMIGRNRIQDKYPI